VFPTAPNFCDVTKIATARRRRLLLPFQSAPRSRAKLGIICARPKRKSEQPPRYEPPELPLKLTSAEKQKRSAAAVAREAARERRAERVVALHAPHTHELPSEGLPIGKRAFVRYGPGLPPAIRAAIVGEGKLIKRADDPCWKVRVNKKRARAPLSAAFVLPLTLKPPRLFFPSAKSPRSPTGQALQADPLSLAQEG
jgi:hypothetical protein